MTTDHQLAVVDRRMLGFRAAMERRHAFDPKFVLRAIILVNLGLK